MVQAVIPGKREFLTVRLQGKPGRKEDNSEITSQERDKE